MMDFLYRFEIDAIARLQRLPIFVDSPYSSFWLFVTWLGDPATIFILHAPILYVLLNGTPVFVRFMLATCVSEFLNGIFKWVLFAHRPYWWVYTSGHANESSSPLKQFPPTCETGPGSPSGHCMVTAAAWIIVVLSCRRGWPRFLAAITFIVALTLLALSRLYVATHFPHQTLLGAIIGSIVGAICFQADVRSAKLGFFMKIVIGLATTTAVTFKTLLWLDFDPNWSIGLAQKYCHDKDWVDLTTTPFASAFRDTGALIGLGLIGQWSNAFIIPKYEDSNIGKKIMGTMLSLIFARAIVKLPILQIIPSLLWFYTVISIEHLVLVVFYTVSIPALLSMGSKVGEKKNN